MRAPFRERPACYRLSQIDVVLDVAVGCICPTKLDARRAFVSLVLTRQTKKYLHAQRRRENACEHVKRQ